MRGSGAAGWETTKKRRRSSPRPRLASRPLRANWCATSCWMTRRPSWPGSRPTTSAGAGWRSPSCRRGRRGARARCGRQRGAAPHHRPTRSGLRPQRHGLGPGRQTVRSAASRQRGGAGRRRSRHLRNGRLGIRPSGRAQVRLAAPAARARQRDRRAVPGGHRERGEGVGRPDRGRQRQPGLRRGRPALRVELHPRLHRGGPRTRAFRDHQEDGDIETAVPEEGGRGRGCGCRGGPGRPVGSRGRSRRRCPRSGYQAGARVEPSRSAPLPERRPPLGAHRRSVPGR